MRLLQLITVLALATASAVPAARAAELPYGRDAVPPTFPDLGPAGNGRRVYLEYNCVGCHGGNAGGEFGPNLAHEDIDDVTEAVTNGETYGGMPPFRKYLNQTDIENLTAYFDSIGKKNQPLWFDWWKPYPKQ